jgi:hypothetical protein
MSEEKRKPRNIQEVMPSAEEVQRELAKAKSMDDFFGKEGIFAKLFAHTIEEMPSPLRSRKSGKAGSIRRRWKRGCGVNEP